MLNSAQAYLAGALGVAFSRVASLAAGIISLWILTKLLETEVFAGYTVAYSIIVLVGYTCGLGIERSMLLTLSRNRPDGRRLVGGRLMVENAALAFLLSTLCAVCLVYFAPDDDAAWRSFFLAWLSPSISAVALTVVLVTWFQANHKVGTAVMMQGISDLTRCGMLAMMLVIGASAHWVAFAVFAGAAMPVAILMARAVSHMSLGSDRLQIVDAVNGLLFLTIRISNIGMRHLDIVVVGLFTSASITAQYVVASRCAALVNFGAAMFETTIAPRCRHHFAAGRFDQASREYRAARLMGFSTSLCIAIFLVLAGNTMLSAFGDFGAGYQAFTALLAANLVIAGFGPASSFLAMLDHLRRAALVKALGLALCAAALFVLVPEYGALGAAATIALTFTFTGFFEVFILAKQTKGTFATTLDYVFLSVPTVTLCTIAVYPEWYIWGALIMSCSLLVSVGVHRAQFQLVLLDLVRIARKTE